MGKQKLSPEAALAKAKRDLRYANTRDREIKRADAQKNAEILKKISRGWIMITILVDLLVWRITEEVRSLKTSLTGQNKKRNNQDKTWQ